ncbi:MAG: hypothetical protein JNG89_05070 [Planctomycetaceae bacterium]|nr:hypothetical protein [Planctomycetaceae bacterium]
MGSPTFALFLRALRTDVRLLHPHIMRMALLAFGLIALVRVQALSFVMGAPGRDFFSQLTFINLFFASLAGPFLFATCITEEKEEQTLGLLRMADIGALSLLVGKLAPRLTGALLILAVQFPFTLLAITLGGVAWQQVVVAFCGLLAHTFLAANLGLFCSVVSHRSGTAAGLAILLLLAHFILPPVVYSVLSTYVPLPASGWIATLHARALEFSEEWYHATATWMMFNIMTTGFAGNAMNVQVVSNVIAGIAIFLVAWAVFDVFNRNVDVHGTSAARTLRDLIRRGSRRSVRAWDGGAAIVGRDFRFANGGLSSWIIKLVAYGPCTYVVMLMVNDWNYRAIDADDFGSVLMGLMLFLALPLELVAISSRVFRSEVKDRTWSSLCMLPNSLPWIAYSKLGGSLLALAPAVFYFVVGALFNPNDVMQYIQDLDDTNTLVGTLAVVANLVFFMHLVAWLSLLMNSWVAILLAFVAWIGAVWLFQLCVIVPFMFMGFAGGGPSQSYFLGVYAVMSIGLLLLAGVLHWHIAGRLRHAAGS